MGNRRLSLVVGGFVVVIAAVFAAVVLTLTSQSGFWKPRYRLVTYFENVQGLIPGAPVRLAGKDVGIVEHVAFGPLSTDRPPVRVVLVVDVSAQERIRSDSVSTIDTIGLLGDKYVEVSMGTEEGRPLQNGEELASVSPIALSDVVTVGTTTLDSISKLAGNVNQLVEEFEEMMGGERVAASMKQISEIIGEIQHGDGLLHELVYGDYETSSLSSVERSLELVESMLAEVQDGQGILHTLIYEPPTEQDLIRNSVEAIASLNRILTKVDAGEGSLGLLLNDPTLYDDVKDLLGGAQRSVVVRSLIRLSSDSDDE
jgi:phospholipid/cholesterol/gamma-HCH transport system substrate-binding protein